jgi:uncharacterized membrane protein
VVLPEHFFVERSMPTPNESEFAYGDEGPGARIDLEGQAISRPEYITAMVHFYRGEMYRATAWRLRLDNTTNWSIISAGGLLTFSFGHPESSPLVLLLGQALLFSFLWIESRRYRFFDVWRSRVRKIEENFFNPILTRCLISPDPLWGDAVANDLSQPRFKMSRWHAIHQRLHANYLVLFVVLNVAWLSKLFMHPIPTRDPAVALARLEMGLVPWWITATGVAAFYGLLVALYVIPGHSTVIRGRQWGLGDEDIEEEER